LGYEPLFTTEQALKECLPYYVDMFHKMTREANEAKRAAKRAGKDASATTGS
jgi:3beta-hydroxy-delta5-steroid dehydrogenase/steroid delta-isomerase